MLTNKNLRAVVSCLVFSLLIAIVGPGCTPPGPRALLEGRKLMDEGKWADAIPRLQEATELLGTNALAWSYLGLAYHQNGQLDQSFKAYQMALKQDHTLSSARFNLGCLHLDMDNLSAALEELRAFTLVQPSAVDGWVKLGTAQYRARRIDEAEKSFRTALGLQPRHPEALNGQGLVQVQRRRFQEAVSLFSLASTQDTNYAPAVLNAAVVYQQYLNNRPLALQHYRRYLALNSAAGDDVRTTVASLERELQPASAAPARASTGTGQGGPGATLAPSLSRPGTSAGTASAAASGPGASLPTGSAPDRRTAEASTKAAATNPPGSSPIASAAAGSPSGRGGAKPLDLVPVTKPPATSTARTAEVVKPSAGTPPLTPAPSPSTGAAAASAATPASTPGRSTAPVVAPVEKLPELEVGRVRDELVVRPAQAASVPGAVPAGGTGQGATAAVAPTATATATATATSTGAASVTAPGGADVPPPPKRGFLSRLNPFSRATRTNGETDGGTAGPASEGAKREVVRPDGLPELAPPSIVRYAYVSPKRPADGNRALATEAFKRGIKAQKAGDRSGAVAEYQAALRADPGFFDAYYNLGLVALDTGDARLSLWAYEYALSIRADSMDARYNLALALKSGGYALDAADQLEILLQENPRDARTHLSLANLAAQQLKQTRRAREHYLRVLELQPRHPEAATIRYWLAANP